MKNIHFLCNPRSNFSYFRADMKLTRTLVMPMLMQAFEGSYAKAGATLTLVYIAGLGLIWFAPETKGKPLPE